MPVGQPTPTTQVYSSTIITSDPSTGKIEAILPGAVRPVIVQGTPVAFRWPVAGEVWRINCINNQFYLDAPLPIQKNSSTATMTAQNSTMTTINGIAPGDAVLNSPTGKVWVLGSPDGKNDLSLWVVNADGTLHLHTTLGGDKQIATTDLRPPATFIYTGTVTPPAGSFTNEKDGDFAIRQFDGELFKRVAGAWVDQNQAVLSNQKGVRHALGTANVTAPTWTANTWATISIPHGLSAVPKSASAFLVAGGSIVSGIYSTNGYLDNTYIVMYCYNSSASTLTGGTMTWNWEAWY